MNRKKKPIKKPSHQIWMGDLEPQWTEQSIIKIWNSIGEAPISVKIIRDKEYSIPMYCFVSFVNAAAMNLALSKNGMPIQGTTKKLRLNHATGSVATSVKDTKSEFTLYFEGELSETAVFDVFNSKYPTSVRQVKISNGNGLIKFNSSATQQIAYKEMSNIVIDGIKLKLSTTQGSTKENDLLKSIQLPHHQPPLNKYTDPNNSTVEVRGLGGRFTEQEIEDHFNFGDMIFIKLSSDFTSAIICYRFREDAERAILLLNHSIINGCELQVNWGQIDNVPLNTNPQLSKNPEIPVVYGFNSFTRFDKLIAESINDWKQSVYEPSETSH